MRDCSVKRSTDFVRDNVPHIEGKAKYVCGDELPSQRNTIYDSFYPFLTFGG